MLYLDVIFPGRHQYVDPSVPGQLSKALRGMSAAVEGGERRRERARSYYVSTPAISGGKSCKSFDISPVNR
jgi:hypothetical protein